jgi:hypothetical protein
VCCSTQTQPNMSPQSSLSILDRTLLFPDRKLFDQLLKRHNLLQTLPARCARVCGVVVSVIHLLAVSLITDPAFGVLINLFGAHRVLMLDVIRGESSCCLPLLCLPVHVVPSVGLTPAVVELLRESATQLESPPVALGRLFRIVCCIAPMFMPSVFVAGSFTVTSHPLRAGG